MPRISAAPSCSARPRLVGSCSSKEALTRSWTEAASVQNCEPAAPALLSGALDSASPVLEAELPSSDPPHAERRTTAAATDSPVRNAVGVGRMDRG
jgi:hypothetical protein